MRDIIDVHSHPVRIPAAARAASSDAELKKKAGFPASPWSEEILLKFMEDSGIATTVLSAIVSADSVGSLEQAKAFARMNNEADAAMKKKYPGKIEFAASAPFSDPQAAIDEIAYAYDHLGACGVKVDSNIGGLYLGNEAFEPIFDELERRKAVLILHPGTPAIYPSNHATGNILPLHEFVVDTTRTVLDMIFAGTLERHPNVKVVVPHCGSFLPALHDRINGLTAILEENDWQPKVDMTKALNNLWYDIGCDAMPTLLKQLLTVAPADHILFGSDFPPIPGKDVEKKIQDMEEAEFLQPFLAGIFRDNAKKLLNI